MPIAYLRLDPLLTGIRDDPRFGQLLARSDTQRGSSR